MRCVYVYVRANVCEMMVVSLFKNRGSDDGCFSGRRTEAFDQSDGV